MLLLVFLAAFGIAFYLNRRNFVTSLCEALIIVALCALFSIRVIIAAAVYFVVRLLVCISAEK